MTANTLETLVLCGFPVLCGGETVKLRRGTGAFSRRNPEIAMSMLNPTHDPVRAYQPGPWHKPEVGDDLGADAGVVGAGRLLRVGTSSRRLASPASRRDATRRSGLAAKADFASALSVRSAIQAGAASAVVRCRIPPAAAR